MSHYLDSLLAVLDTKVHVTEGYEKYNNNTGILVISPGLTVGSHAVCLEA
jgi:hypothetical protein